MSHLSSLSSLRGCAGLLRRSCCPPGARAAAAAAGGARRAATAPSATASDPGPLDLSQSGRVNIYTSYTVYKSKGALSLKLIKPTWERVASGSGLRVARDGTALLEFAAAAGTREYAWDAKETFALSAVECAELLEAADAGREASFFHDPAKGGPGEGAVTKSLRVAPGRDSGYFFNLSVANKAAGATARYDAAVSPAELRVLRRVMDFAIPRLLGFDEQFAGAPIISADGGGGGGGGPPPPF